MNLQVLLSAMNCEPQQLAKTMNLNSDTIMINQCDYFSYEEFTYNGHLIKAYSLEEKGVGLSRNNGLLRASADIVLFADDDIVYNDNYEELVIREFTKHPEADIIFFQFDVCESRRTFMNEGFKKVSWYNCGRYPTFCMAARTEQLHKKNITFSLLFGGGAKYSNGEDSLFIKECISKGLRAFSSDLKLGKEVESDSTWFNGYHEKFFIDRGVLYSHLYGKMAYLFAVRFLMAHKNTMCKEIKYKEALKLMKKGIKIGR